MATLQADRSQPTPSSKAAVGRLFVLDLSDGSILTMNPDGSDRKVIVTGCRHPDGIVVDVEAGGIYWTDMGVPNVRLEAEKVIICTGGVSRRLPIPGFELTSTHSDAWALTSVPPSMLVVGAGATGVQVASIFNAFGTHIQLFEAGPRILATEDDDVSATAAAAFRASGIGVRENFGTIERFEKRPTVFG